MAEGRRWGSGQLTCVCVALGAGFPVPVPCACPAHHPSSSPQLAMCGPITGVHSSACFHQSQAPSTVLVLDCSFIATPPPRPHCESNVESTEIDGDNTCCCFDKDVVCTQRTRRGEGDPGGGGDD